MATETSGDGPRRDDGRAADGRRRLRGRIHHNVSRANHAADEGSWRDGGDVACDESGFVFVRDPTDGGGGGPIREVLPESFQLVVPHRLLGTACRAAATGTRVALERYSAVRYNSSSRRGELVYSTQDGNGSDRRRTYSAMDSLRIDNRYVVEVHAGGLRLDDGEGETKTAAFGHDAGKTHEEEVLTLAEFSAREAARQEGRDEDAAPPRKKRRKVRAFGSSPISVAGTVDAVSPILVKDGSPFALVELYQSADDGCDYGEGGDGDERGGGGDVYTAAAILKGEDALSVHPAIEPGRTVTLSDVVSRKWEAGKGFRDRAAAAAAGNDKDENGLFQRLGRRVPDRVLFVSEARSVKLDDGCRPNVEEDDCPPLPSTVESLSSVRGAVEAVHYHFGESSSDEVASHVTLRLNGEKNGWGEIAQVSLAKHALCPNLALGIQVGAMLRLVNVHRVPRGGGDDLPCCYLACLRSTVTIERCASESHRSESEQQWFLPRTEHHFAMLADRRVGEMCEPSAVKTAEQHIAEERFVSGLGRALGRNVARRVVDRLLTAHRAIDLGGPAGGEPAGPTARRERSARRDPYAEFFDHGHDASHCDTSCVECGTPSGDLAAFRQRQLSTAIDIPRVASLTELRDGCASDFVSKITALFAGQSDEGGSSSGWTASATYRGAELGRALDGRGSGGTASASTSTAASGSSAEGTDIYTFGEVSGGGSCVVGDGRCRMPLCVSDGVDSPANDRDFDEAWVRLDAVSVSCLCVGSSRMKSVNGNGGGSLDFLAREPLHAFLSGRDDAGNDGHSFVFRVEGLIFAASVHMVPKAVLTASTPSPMKQMREVGDNIPREPLSIQECLEQSPADGVLDNSGRIGGQLVRKRFQFRKRTSDAGLEMTLCHATEPSAMGFLGSASALQSIEVKTSVPLCEASGGRNALEAALAAIHGCGSSGGGILSEQQMTMAIAWFVLAERPNTAPLTTSGLDQPSLSPAHQLVVCVKLPLTCRSLSNHGYQRFFCHVSDLNASYIQGRETARSTQRKIKCSRSLFIPGMLIDRNLWTSPTIIPKQSSDCRKPSSEPADKVAEVREISPLPIIENETGVPSFTLSQIHWEICAVLREGCSSHLRPSLVRRVRKAKILGITFCRAHIECASCFRVLNTPCRVCPNGCSRVHASVKWEVSATIDDGTGQAKLYADRDAALLVLGSGLDASTVEQGAWLTNEGILFQPSLPASTHLLRSIKEATLKVRRELTDSRLSQRGAYSVETSEIRANSSSVKNSAQRKVFDMLPDDGKAEYLLQQHCRHWYQNNCDRKLDLFVRCKPLSEHATTVNRAEIQVAQAVSAQNSLEFGLSISATLPPLKLKLEDACFATEGRQENRMAGWDLLKSFQR